MVGSTRQAAKKCGCLTSFFGIISSAELMHVQALSGERRDHDVVYFMSLQVIPDSMMALS
jgi:hypothetical protein